MSAKGMVLCPAVADRTEKGVVRNGKRNSVLSAKEDRSGLRCGRDPKEVTLIAVSKTTPVSMIQEIMEEQTDFGENKPQELRDKYEVLPKDLRWHMIGHLQRNKIKYIIDKTCLIHSVDSLRLAEAIDEEAQKHGIRMPVLIEVNMAKEES